MKYKVGDKVRIVSERVEGMNPDGAMDCWLEKIMTINKVNKNGIHHYKMEEDHGRWGWDNNMIAGLTEPELTAEELLQTISEICSSSICHTCPINYVDLKEFDEPCHLSVVGERSAKIIKICRQWKSEHEKKAPEIETVDICRIIEILPDGRKRCVHEEDIKPDPDLPFGGGERETVEEMLKSYCMEHEGEFIAVHEVVSRVKAAN